MDKNKLLASDVLERFVMGDVSPEEQALVEQAIRTSPEVQKSLEVIENTFLQVSKENALLPNPNTKASILDKIDQLSAENTVDFSAPYKFWKKMAAIAAAIGALVLIGGAFYYSEYKNMSKQYHELQAQFITLSNTCNEAQNTAKQNQEVLTFLQNPSTEIIPLVSINNQQASANAFWNPTAQQALINIGALPELSNDEVYQLWADIEGEMVDMGVLNANTTLQEIPFMAQAESLNITIEPAGGSDHPMVERLVVVGKV